VLRFLLSVPVVLCAACFFDTTGVPVEGPDLALDLALDQASDQTTDTIGADATIDTLRPDASKDTSRDISADIRRDTTPDLAPDLMPWLKPLAHWRFDKGTGSTAFDAVGSNNGTIVNATWTTQGYAGGGLSFNGSSSYVEIPHASTFNLASTISIVAWIKADTIGDRQVIVSKTASGNNAWLLEINPVDFNDGIINFYLNTGASAGGGSNLGSKTAVSKSSWQHLAAVYDGKNRIIYLNGNADQTAAHTGKIHTNSLSIRIGSWSSGGRFFKGTIDEVAIFDSALSAAEVKQIYTKGL
jgi:hypothetical protein